MATGAWLNVFDIESHLFPRFQAAAGCPHLPLGSLLRGLGRVTRKRERAFMDASGRRSSIAEYRVPTRRKAREGRKRAA